MGIDDVTTVGMDSVNDRPHVLGNRYEVGDLLGRGGMAEVHIGRDTRLGRVVAIKLLRTDLARDATFQARFKREAQSAAALNHPAIVAVYDTGEEQVVEAGGAVVSLPYIVMEYVEGHTLRELMHDGQPLEVGAALDVTARVLSALEYSHRAGIVHRDIKPANVMMTTNGDVKVMDFGIARAMSDASSTMTQTQAVIGTAQYLSPEQARGETVDARSDLYSGGCLLYELLTGRPPFVADSPVAVAYQHVREEPQPPSVFNPAVPANVDRIVLHALAKDRETRYQTAADFRDDLEAALAGRPVSAAAAAASAATTQFMGAPGAGTRTMQPVTEPVGGLYGAAAPTAAVGGGMLPGSPLEEEYSYTRRDRRPEPSGSRTGVYWLLALAILVVAGLAGFTFYQLSGKHTPTVTTIKVPPVTGQSLKDAQTTLASAKFTKVTSTPKESDEPVGTVLDQDPKAGTDAQPTDLITLTVSSGKGQAAVPPLVGKSRQEAIKALQDAGLNLGDIEVVDAPGQASETVTKSDPPSGTTLDKGKTVKLTVASGLVQLPDLKGKDQTTAVAALAALQLKYKITLVDAPEGTQAGVVLSTDPGGPSKVPYNQAVKLTVSQAPTPPPPSASASPTPTPTVTPTP